jgi:hypothetical protein
MRTCLPRLFLAVAAGCASAMACAEGYRLTVGAVILNRCSAQVTFSVARVQCVRPIVSAQSLRIRDDSTRTITVLF